MFPDPLATVAGQESAPLWTACYLSSMSLRKLFPVLVLGGGVVSGLTGCSSSSDSSGKVDAGTSTTGTTSASAEDAGEGGAAPAATDDASTGTGTGTGTGGGAPSGW